MSSSVVGESRPQCIMLGLWAVATSVLKLAHCVWFLLLVT